MIAKIGYKGLGQEKTLDAPYFRYKSSKKCKCKVKALLFPWDEVFQGHIKLGFWKGKNVSWLDFFLRGLGVKNLVGGIALYS